jgi:predicted Zn-dependent protease with MMP-like domain
VIIRRERARFDELMERAVEELPPPLRQLLEEVPVIVIDRPSSAMLRSLGLDAASEDDALSLCGLHTGRSITERSVVDDAVIPEDIHLFREGILDLAGGFEQLGGDDLVYEQIRITLLHEIGHHFGLDEDDLARLGYD